MKTPENKKKKPPVRITDYFDSLPNNLIQDLPVAVYVCDKKGYVTQYNKSAALLWGCKPEPGKVQWCGASKVFELDGTPVSAESCAPALLLKGGQEDVNREIVIERPDGSRKNTRSFPSLLYDDKGNVSGVVNMVEDLTERNIHEAHMSHLAAIAQYSDDAIISKSLEGTIKSWNKGAEKMFGYLEAEAVGKNIAFIIPPEFIHEEKNILEQIRKNATIEHYETVRMNKKGEHFYVSLTISPLRDKSGTITGISKIARNITELKQTSQYTRSLIEASRDPLITISTDGKIMDLNNALIEVVEKTREQLIGTDFINYFTDSVKARDGYREVFEKGFLKNYPLTIKDGKLTPVLFNGSTYKDQHGKVLGAVVVARDISEQKRTEAELIEAKVFAELATLIAEEAKSKAESATRIAEDAVKAKQQFLSNMSHEIRTPMNAIIGFTKVVLKTELTAKQKEYVTAIKMSGDSLIVLINDILDLAKADAGKMTFEQTPFKLALSISAMIHLFETKIQEKNLTLVQNYDTTIPEVLVGDPVRLHQIIINLLSNAVKFTATGQITVSVHLLKEDEGQATIEFSVKDTGIGITKHKLAKIFENFQQASSSTSRLYGGTGLGLAIVKKLVESQEGSIRVKSKLDEGSTFSFTLKFQKTKAAAELVTEIVEVDNETKNIKVLVVEDIALNQLLMKTLLDDFGFGCDIAANGKIAVEKLQINPYDIILMDLQMPEMNGFEATEYIRTQLNSKIPIIALTADVTTVDLAKCKAVGMNDYIAKPVDERLLYSKIVSLVKKPEMAKYADREEEPLKNSKCIDLDYLIRRTKSDPKLMMEMISLYLEQTPPLISAIKQSFQDRDWNSLHMAVHKMIPSFSIMGISADYENMAKKIQEYASAQQQIDDISELVLALEHICVQACRELEAEFIRIKTNIK